MAKKNPAWKQCEIDYKKAYEAKGCVVIPTGIGSDFLAACPREKPALIEVKQGGGKLTKVQRVTKAIVEKTGVVDYRVERCGCEYPNSKRSDKSNFFVQLIE